MCSVFLAVALGAVARLFPQMQTAALSVTQPLFDMILGASGFTVTEERAERVYFSEPNYTGGIVAVVAES